MLIALGFKDGINDLKAGDIKTNQTISKDWIGNYGTLNSFSKVQFNADITNVVHITVNSKTIYIINKSFLFYRLDDCNSCRDYDLVYDFQCKDYILKSGHRVNNLDEVKVKYNTSFRFKIINFNRYLHSAEVQIDDVFFQSETPDMFNKIFLGKGLEFKTLNEKAADTANTKNFAMLKDMNLFIEDLKTFKNQYNELVENNNKAFSLCIPDVGCCNTENKYSFKELSRLLLELKLSYNDQIATTETKIIRLEKLTKDKDISKVEADITKLNKRNSELEKKPKKTKNENEEVAANKVALAKLENEKVELQNLEILKINKASLEKIKPDLDKLTDEDLLQLVHFQNNLIKNNFEYIVPTVFPKGDLLSIKVYIKRNDKPEFLKWQNAPLYEEENFNDLRVRNKWFYSFSTGPFVGLGNNFKTETYGWKRANQPDATTGITNPVIDNNSKYQLVSTGQRSEPVGIAALANFGKKVSNFVGVGAAIGVGTTIEDSPKLSYLFGFTIFFGQDKQFNLTPGFSFIQVEKLKKGLYNTSSTDFYNTKQDLEFDKKFVNGWFVAITYSVFTKSTSNKTNSSKAKNVETDQGKNSAEETVQKDDKEKETPKETPKDKSTTADTKQLVVPIEVLKKGTKFKIKN